MIDDIRKEIASRLHLIRIQVGPPDARRPSRTLATSQSASHSSMGAFGAAAMGGKQGGGSPMGDAGNPRGAQVVRSQPKVGRNDPCPCGSGRKYKHCHGSS